MGKKAAFKGFPGEHFLVVPDGIVEQMRQNPLTRLLYPTATGYFPRAAGHFVERKQGLPEVNMQVCQAGLGWARVGDGPTFEVRGGEVLIIPPGTPHAYGAQKFRPWSIMWAHFRGDDAEYFLKLLEVTPASPLRALPRGRLAEMGFSEVYELIERGYTPSNLLSSAARLRYFLTELSRIGLANHPAGGPMEKQVQKTLQWMKRHPKARATLGELAGMAGLSVSHYSELFRRDTGFSPLDFFLRQKMKQACGLLDASDLRIKEVAAEFGYEDAFHFSRLFKRLIGQSPESYRLRPKR